MYFVSRTGNDVLRETVDCCGINRNV